MGCKASKGVVTEAAAPTDAKQLAAGKETEPERAVGPTESPASVSVPNLFGQGTTEATTLAASAAQTESEKAGDPDGGAASTGGLPSEAAPSTTPEATDEQEPPASAPTVDCTTDPCGFNEWHQAVKLDELALALKLNCLPGQGTPKASSE